MLGSQEVLLDWKDWMVHCRAPGRIQRMRMCAQATQATQRLFRWARKAQSRREGMLHPVFVCENNCPSCSQTVLAAVPYRAPYPAWQYMSKDGGD